MSVIFNAGENKLRPGIYRRQSNIGFAAPTGGQDGICAIPVQASWGPLGKVVKHTRATELTETYGNGTYGTGYTVPAAEAMFKGGASTVYTYRLGKGGKASSKELASGLTVTAKYPGTLEIKVAVQPKLGDTTTKQFMVYTGNSLVETFEFAADTKTEGANLIKAASASKYVNVTGSATTVAAVAVADGALAGGANPTVTNNDYSTAFAALEPYYYNTIAIDVDDTDLTISKLLHSYLKSANALGKLGMAVVGEKTTIDFAVRCKNAKAFNDEKVVYLGGGYKAGTEDKDGVMAICYTAGVIASTPSNQGITHTAISEATDLCESLTFAQYEEAIANGMLMLSMSPDGSIWYDTGINTLVTPGEVTHDDGWKKIRRTKVRFEMIDRLDRALAPKVGKVSADSDGIADVIQTGQRVLDTMANTEGKLQPGASFIEDPSNPYAGDSAWFIIQADDIDSLEKIYLHYQFRYSQNV